MKNLIGFNEYFNNRINEGISPIDKLILKNFAKSASLLLKKGKDKKLILAALGIIGRESDYGASLRYKILNPVKIISSLFTDNSSSGYGQITLKKAKEMGYDLLDIQTPMGALSIVYDILEQNYKKAKEMGYSTNAPSSNFKEGTGDAALDIAILAFNAGIGKICKYCETTHPKIKRCCNSTNKEFEFEGKKYKITDKIVPNYLPNFKTTRFDKVNITSHGYVKEVAERMEKLAKNISLSGKSGDINWGLFDS